MSNKEQFTEEGLKKVKDDIIRVLATTRGVHEVSDDQLEDRMKTIDLMIENVKKKLKTGGDRNPGIK